MDRIVIVGPLYDISGYGALTRRISSLLISIDNLDVYLKAASFTSNKIYTSEFEAFENKQLQPINYKDTSALHILTPNLWIYLKGLRYNIGCYTFECNDIPQNWILPIKGMDFIYVMSQHDREVTAQYRSKDTIQVLKYYVDPGIFNPSGEVLEKNDKFIIGTVMDWNPRKGNDLVFLSYLSAFDEKDKVELWIKTYFAPEPNRTLTIVRNDLNAIMKTLKKNKKPKIKLFIEPMTKEDLAKFYRSLDVFLFPSRGEGWGIPAHEAMACGIPIIAPRHTGLKDFIPKYELNIKFREAKIPDNSSLLLINKIYQDLNWYNPDLSDIIEKLRIAYYQYGKDIKRKFGNLMVQAANLYTKEGFCERLLKKIRS
ncbi:MAG: glycosyltransferase [Candidatus Helarchaeota archaeon]